MQVFVFALVLTLQLPNFILALQPRCYGHICGQNAHCTIVSGGPVCSCLKGYIGDPLSICNRTECFNNSECGSHLTCVNKRCVDPCVGVCGSNATCETNRNHIPVCFCPAGYTGNPFTHCRQLDPSELCHSSPCRENTQCEVNGDPLSICNRVECFDNSECKTHLKCVHERCVDPCVGVCGGNANCETKNHIPVCSCPAEYTGNPFTSCRRFDPSELCHPSPCGQNTQCEVIGETPVCKCLSGYHGSPIAGCRHECDSDAECGSQYACIEFKCQNPCAQCGINAVCDIVPNHIPVCKCPKNYYGNALTSCQPECVNNSDCPPGKPVCFDNACKNPCEGVCGTNANCELKKDFTPVCSCPKNMTGDPFISCRPFTKADLCEPNPCGANAQCQPGYDKTYAQRPVCSCLPEYLGDPLVGCIRGECIDDAACPDHQTCFEYKCQNPCRNQCGVNAMCNPRRHIAVCTCLPGYNGDSLTQCHQVEQTYIKSEVHV